jgi:hypothetical protein
MLTKEQQVMQCAADDLGREIIRAMRGWADSRGSGEVPAAVPLLAPRQALVSVLEMATPENVGLYADNFIRSLSQYPRKGASAAPWQWNRLSCRTVAATARLLRRKVSDLAVAGSCPRKVAGAGGSTGAGPGRGRGPDRGRLGHLRHLRWGTDQGRAE